MTTTAAHSTTHVSAPPEAGTTSFDVVLIDGSHERVDGADAYQQEQSMTTFFRSDGRRQAVDCWSVRVASFRTDHIVAVRRIAVDPAAVRHLQSV
jgi:hypothetical protein